MSRENFRFIMIVLLMAFYYILISMRFNTIDEKLDKIEQKIENNFQKKQLRVNK